MTFPVAFHLFGRDLHSHLVLELLAYTVGFQLYLLLRRRNASRASVPLETMSWIIVGCVFGALFGSKILAWIESAPDYWSHRDNLASWLGGKTIVGGLLGGWIGVEIAKKILGVKQSTGDTFVFPLIVGIAIGRVGCFLTGLADHTHGVHTNLPWAVDFGDGLRHPTQLYEIAFLIVLGIALFIRARRPHREGEIFRLFILGYMSFRFLVEFIKPRFHPYLGLSAIQLAAVIAIVVCAVSLRSKRELATDGAPICTDEMR